MVMTRTANVPLSFSGQTVAYSSDSTYNERTIVSTVDQPAAFSEGKVRYNVGTGNVEICTRA